MLVLIIRYAIQLYRLVSSNQGKYTGDPTHLIDGTRDLRPGEHRFLPAPVLHSSRLQAKTGRQTDGLNHTKHHPKPDIGIHIGIRR